MLNFVVALPSEARPLIDHLGLRPIAGAAAFPHWGKDGVNLLVSGPGKVAAAAATAYLGGLLEARPPGIWLNIGIAGHRQLPLGTPLLAHQIIDRASGQTYYPVFTWPTDRPTGSVETVDTPESQYPENRAYDMEASGFFPTACRFASAELVHCLKIVSDNRQTPLDGIDKKKVEGLIKSHLDLVDATVDHLQPRRRELAALRSTPPLYRELVQRHHFSATQQHRLHRLLAALAADGPALEDLLQLANGRAVLRELETRCQNLPLL